MSHDLPARAGAAVDEPPPRHHQDRGHALDQLLQGRRVAPCTWSGRPAFAKRKTQRRAFEGVLLALFGPLLRRLACPGVPFRPVRRTDPRSFEVQRLRELAAAGMHVPQVLAESGCAFVMESLGRSLEHDVHDGTARAGALLLSAAADLAAFHAAGHWHGGAQIRNMAWRHGRIARFDFDRAYDRHLPLPLLQALDVLLFLGSIGSWAEPALTRDVAAAYLQGSSAPVRAILVRTAAWAARLGRARWLQGIAPKEAGRLRASAAALEAAGLHALTNETRGEPL